MHLLGSSHLIEEYHPSCIILEWMPYISLTKLRPKCPHIHWSELPLKRRSSIEWCTSPSNRLSVWDKVGAMMMLPYSLFSFFCTYFSFTPCTQNVFIFSRFLPFDTFKNVEMWPGSSFPLSITNLNLGNLFLKPAVTVHPKWLWKRVFIDCYLLLILERNLSWFNGIL